MLGENKVHLQLIELPQAMDSLMGVIEEVKDLASPIIQSIFGTSDTKEGFTNADIVLLVGAMPRGPNMTRGDLISKNASIFKYQGEILNEVAKENVKICVVGNPTNVNATILSKYAPNVSKKNITCLTRLDQNRLYGQIASKFRVNTESISNGIIWGNHSSSMVVDINHCKIGNQKL